MRLLSLIWLCVIGGEIVRDDDGSHDKQKSEPEQPEECPAGKFLIGWKKHDYLSWHSSLSCAMTLAKHSNRTFVLPEYFWYYTEGHDWDEALNIKRLQEFSPGIAMKWVQWKLVPGHDQMYDKRKKMTPHPGMGRCDIIQSQLDSTKCVLQGQARWWHSYCSQIGYGECFYKEPASQYILPANATMNLIMPHVNKVKPYIIASLNDHIQLEIIEKALENLGEGKKLSDFKMILIDCPTENTIVEMLKVHFKGTIRVDTFTGFLDSIRCDAGVFKHKGCKLFESQRKNLVQKYASLTIKPEMFGEVIDKYESERLAREWREYLSSSAQKKAETLTQTSKIPSVPTIDIEVPTKHGPWAMAYRLPNSYAGTTKFAIVFWAKSIVSIESRCFIGSKVSVGETFTPRQYVDDDYKHTYGTVMIECIFAGLVEKKHDFITVSYGPAQVAGAVQDPKFVRARIWREGTGHPINHQKFSTSDSQGSMKLPHASDMQERADVTICIPTFFCPSDMNVFDSDYVVEWLEYHSRVLGASHAFLYSDDQHCVHGITHKLKSISRLPMKISIVGMYDHLGYVNNTHYHGQTIAIQDCWMRNRVLGNYWTFFLDFDELVTWPSHWKGITWREKFEGYAAVTLPSWKVNHRICLKKGEGNGRLNRMIFSEMPSSICFQRAKNCNHAGHLNCCIGFCGHRKYAIVPHRGKPLTIHLPEMQSVSTIHMDTRSGLYIRHVAMPVLDSSKTTEYCKKTLTLKDLTSGSKSGVASIYAPQLIAYQNLSSELYPDELDDMRSLVTKGGVGGPYNKGTCTFVL
jgi:hypothetical protein